MAKIVVDLETPSLTIGDITWDYIKTLSSLSPVSSEDSSLTECASASEEYVLDNPNIIEDAVFRIHVTADDTKVSKGVLSLSTGNIATESTLQALSEKVDLIDAYAGNNIITINVEDLNTSTSIPDTFVRITDSTTTQTLTRGSTDSVGQFTAALDDGDYKVILRKAFYDFTVPESLTVSGSGTVTYQGSGFSPSSTTPETSGTTCIVYGWVTDMGGTPVRNAVITAVDTESNRFVDSQKIVKTTKQIKSNNNGYWELELIRSNLLTLPDVPYKIIITYPGFSYEINIIVPSVTSVNFSTLI